MSTTFSVISKVVISKVIRSIDVVYPCPLGIELDCSQLSPAQPNFLSSFQSNKRSHYSPDLKRIAFYCYARMIHRVILLVGMLGLVVFLNESRQ